MKNSTCFVCKNTFRPEQLETNRDILMSVCYRCKGTEEEKKNVEEYLDSLADGYVCGCI